MKKTPIRKIISHSLVDGPGNRTSVFLQGCNLRCEYCHNPETIEIIRDMNSTEVQWMTAVDVFHIVQKDIPFIRGITLSGGECTIYPEFLQELFTLSKKAGLSCLIDSNGTVDLSRYPEMMRVCDGVMLDVKAWEEEKFKRLTSGTSHMVKKNLKFLADTKKLEEIRVVCIPDEVDTENILNGIKDTIGEAIKDTRLRLTKFRNHGVTGRLKDTDSPSDEYMDNLKNMASDMGFKVIKN